MMTQVPHDVRRRVAKLRGLIDEYRLYLHPVVLGGGKPFFAGPRPPLRLIATDRMDEDVIERVNDIWDRLGLPGDKTPIWK